MKVILVSAILFSSLSVFALGRTDDSAIEEKVNELKEQGYDCQAAWPKDFIQAEKDAKLDFEYTCVHEKLKEKKFIIVYEAKGTPGARCRDRVALSIKEKVKSKEKIVEDSSN